MTHTLRTILLAGVITTLSACTAITDVTSSTSSTTDTVTPDVTLNNFIDKRYDAIRQDAARGRGENIEALSQLVGAKDSASLAIWMQMNYDQLFGQHAKPADLVTRLKQYASDVKA